MFRNVLPFLSDPPASNFNVTQKKGNEVVIKWSNPVACYGIESISIFAKIGSTQQTFEELTSEVTLINLEEKTEYVLQTRVNYEGGKSSPVTEFRFDSGVCAPDVPNCKLCNITNSTSTILNI